MTRAPVNRHRVEYGENAVWTAPAGAARWLARRKAALHDVFGDTANLASPTIYGGEAPTGIEFGGYDIAADEVIEATDKANDGLESVATAAGATVPWITLTDLADGLDTEIVQFIAYDGDGRAMQIDRFAVPAPNATDASTIAGQERRLLQTLLQARERAAGTGGVRRHDEGEGSAMSTSPSPPWTGVSPRPARASHGSSRPPKGTRFPARNTGRA